MNKNSTRYFSNKQESCIAKSLGGVKVPNSGACKFLAGDVRTKQFLIEAKTVTTHKDSFSIKLKWLLKNKEEAFAMNKPYSALAFNFGPDEKNYYIIDEKLFKELVKYIEED